MNGEPTSSVGAAPPRIVWESAIRRGLEEDLGTAGDLTTDAIVPADAVATAAFVARSVGVVAGLPMIGAAFELMDPSVEVERQVDDGERVTPGTTLATVRGPARAVLTGERTALNLLGRLSGIATVTRELVDLVEAAEAPGGKKAQVVCTRKTTPGLRALEKYAVRAGGGSNHRFGLDDAILIKDNHVAIAGGVEEAVRRVRAHAGHMVKVELEVDRLDQLERALELGVEAVLLDNMSLEELRRAVALCEGRAITEASGGINPETIGGVAATGVDLISVGYLTHSAPSLDVGLDMSDMRSTRGATAVGGSEATTDSETAAPRRAP